MWTCSNRACRPKTRGTVLIQLQGPSTIINFDEELTVLRNGQVLYKDGKPLDFKIIEFKTTCNVQPLNGRDLLLVPEGDRHKEQYWLYTNNCDMPLQVNDRVIRTDPQSTEKCINYQLQSLENWGSYQRARIMRIDVGPNAKKQGS